MSLEFSGVWLELGGRAVLRDLTLRCGTGLTAVLGPNGAGKSCLLRVAAGVLRPSRGHVRWLGLDAVRDPFWYRDCLGYLPQRAVLYPDMTAREFLGHLAALKGIPRRLVPDRVTAVLELVGLADRAAVPTGRLSHGQRRRLGLAQALLNDPYLLVLDQPTAGLDPESRVSVLALLRKLAADRVVLMATNEPGDVTAQDALARLEGGRLAGGSG